MFSLALLDVIFLGSPSQFVVLLYLLTYVGALTNGLTLVITGEFCFHQGRRALVSRFKTSRFTLEPVENVTVLVVLTILIPIVVQTTSQMLVYSV